VRILIVGLGGIGQRHVRNLRALLGEGLGLFAVRARGRRDVITDGLQIEPGAEVEARYGIRSLPTLEAGLALQPDAVLVCNPSSGHLQVARAAAEAGCALFVEKPLSHSWTGVEELVEIVERRGLVTAVGFQLRFHPCLQRVHDLLEQGAVGQVLAARVEVGEYLPGFHSYEDYRALYASRRDLGGGVVLSQIHELDYLGWFFGAPRRLFAVGGHLSSLEIDVEDVASVLMECRADGRAIPVHLHLDFVQRPPARTCEIVGDAGRIDADLRALTVTLWDREGRLAERRSFEGFERNRMFLDEMSHFLDCIAGRATPLVPVREGARSLRTALAVLESLASGRVVETSP
jgi:predicted dehydrogenase